LSGNINEDTLILNFTSANMYNAFTFNLTFLEPYPDESDIEDEIIPVIEDLIAAPDSELVTICPLLGY